ncbi:hypothetical protein PISMIDRAFT_261872 [Pisolithus microcarpus 441]|uniref:Uncharacterized protein n=1 Tax=Pisolithus microcarpus 441 TaxID=765257 RepID=A0A0C9ZBF7_9AGAM|nr:hypothetical protein BKA83DRAFT_261872 [Pisolithus microcarpus]KIK26556.1 hypothetical protein PISMIDRAFT_261872 [Pisolithus microcarpus 441]
MKKIYMQVCGAMLYRMVLVFTGLLVCTTNTIRIHYVQINEAEVETIRCGQRKCARSTLDIHTYCGEPRQTEQVR